MSLDPAAPEPYDAPDKRQPPISAVPVAPAGRKWTGTLPDKYVATLVELVSTSALRSTVEVLAAFHTRHTFSANIGPAAELIAGWFTAAGYSDVVRRPWTRSGHTADNVVCTKPGTGGGGRIIIVCAHYDSRMEDLGNSTARAPGADDNGSGVAAMLEIARLLAPVTLADTVRFVAFSGEEQGLWGSTAYAAELHAAGANVHRVINLDMVGRPPTDGSVTVERDLGNAVPGNDAASQDFGAVMAQAAADYTTLPVKLGPIYASDYMPFEARGYVTIGAYEGEGNPHYHRTTDEPATLDYGYLTQVTRMTLATLLAESLEVVDETGSAVDLYIRDSPDDTGSRPSGVPHRTSPDLWVRNNPPPGDDPELGHQPPINDAPNLAEHLRRYPLVVEQTQDGHELHRPDCPHWPRLSPRKPGAVPAGRGRAGAWLRRLPACEPFTYPTPTYPRPSTGTPTAGQTRSSSGSPTCRP